MASPDAFLIANVGRDLKDEVMANVRNYAAIANTPDIAKVAFGLMDKALESFIVPGLRTLGADIRDGSILLHRIFELRGLYHKVQDVVQASGTIESSVYKTIYEVTRAVQGRRLAEKMAVENADNANSPDAPSVLLPAAEISISKESLKTTRHSSRVKSAKIIIDSDEDETPKAEMSLIDLLDAEDSQMKVDTDLPITAVDDPAVEEEVPIISKMPAHASVILLDYCDIPGIDHSHIFIKAQKVIAKAEKQSKNCSSKKASINNLLNFLVGKDLATSHANIQMIQSCIGQTEFEVAYLTRCINDLAEQENILRLHIKELEHLEKSIHKGKGKSLDS
ncbi:hypothetical protein CPB84DRAFT_1848511 [Gymnopilus junonius]|uniref:Uncharacterized protein n=1 Tax=Gymnopilus junonius TaxID=109634 RepID=A0A9P5NKX4_GYMJU|nr:hypothetical protein CPB84DRAFT_1848511 [Gymnopilus junonius]